MVEDNVVPMGANWQTKAEAGYIEFEYIGKHKNEIVFGPAPSGRRYRAGNNIHHKYIWVHPSDEKYISRLACFKKAKKKAKKALVSNAVPTAPPTPDGLDITKMTVADVLEYDFSAYNVKALDGFIAAERIGKNRTTVITALKRVQRKQQRRVPA